MTAGFCATAASLAVGLPPCAVLGPGAGLLPLGSQFAAATADLRWERLAAAAPLLSLGWYEARRGHVQTRAVWPIVSFVGYHFMDVTAAELARPALRGAFLWGGPAHVS